MTEYHLHRCLEARSLTKPGEGLIAEALHPRTAPLLLDGIVWPDHFFRGLQRQIDPEAPGGDRQHHKVPEVLSELDKSCHCSGGVEAGL